MHCHSKYIMCVPKARYKRRYPHVDPFMCKEARKS
jgi:hypothetical protein